MYTVFQKSYSKLKIYNKIMEKFNEILLLCTKGWTVNLFLRNNVLLIYSVISMARLLRKSPQTSVEKVLYIWGVDPSCRYHVLPLEPTKFAILMWQSFLSSVYDGQSWQVLCDLLLLRKSTDWILFPPTEQ